MRDYGMDYGNRGSGWTGGRNRGYDNGYGAGGHQGGWNRGGGYNGSWTEGEWTGYGAGGRDYGYEGTNRGEMNRGEMNRGGMQGGYGRDYGAMDRGYDHEHRQQGGPRFFRHWADTGQDEDYAWESGRHGMPGGMNRGGYQGRGEMDRGGDQRWMDDNGFPRGYQGRGVHNFAGNDRDHFRAYGANFPNRYDPRW